MSFTARLYVSDTDLPGDFFAGWYNKMPAARRSQCDRFKNEADRKRCIAAYALLVYALKDLLGSCDDILSISQDQDGKPFLTDIPVCFNISHSGDRVAVALAASAVGCDVEHIREKGLDIAKRFFSDEEYAYLSAIDDERAARGEFTRLWTMKESVVKCCGEGIRHELGDFSLVDMTGARRQTIRLSGFDDHYHIMEFETESGYCYSLCSTCNDIENSIRRVKLT
ncbi:MAG: 4'-phosphopantetheinyl transferase superfamily protein [Lachnospiraceae bacterium]|nr:4'-phosphopantetheinyl transferase superfamily protein [Lachnospiraceae bacterium]